MIAGPCSAVLPHPALAAHPSLPAELPTAVLRPVPPQGGKPLIAMFVLSPQGSTPSRLLDTSNSLKAHVDRPWPRSTSSVPSLPQESLPPPSCTTAAPQAGGQSHRPAGRPVISSTSQTSHPAAQHASPRPRGWEPGWGRREQGAPFPPPGKAVSLASRMFPPPPPTQAESLPGPSKHTTTRELGQDQELKSCTASARHMESPSFPTHNKQPSVKKTRHTQETSETWK